MRNCFRNNYLVCSYNKLLKNEIYGLIEQVVPKTLTNWLFEQVNLEVIIIWLNVRTSNYYETQTFQTCSNFNYFFEQVLGIIWCFNKYNHRKELNVFIQVWITTPDYFFFYFGKEIAITNTSTMYFAVNAKQ